MASKEARYTIQRAMAYGRTKVGVGENPNGSNHTEFWARMYPDANKPGHNWAWCAAFGTDVYATGVRVDFRPIVNWAFHCGYWRRKAISDGVWRSKSSGYSPVMGDVVIYGADEHFGLINASAAPGTINTLEGNTSPTSSGSQYDGGIVALKTRNLSWVNGYIDMGAWLDKLAVQRKVVLLRPPVIHLPTNPAWPLQPGYYFGPRYPLSNRQSVSGYYSHTSDLMRWQQKTRDSWKSRQPADGHFGPYTEGVAKALQKILGQPVTGRIDKKLWDATFAKK